MSRWQGGPLLGLTQPAQVVRQRVRPIQLHLICLQPLAHVRLKQLLGLLHVAQLASHARKLSALVLAVCKALLRLAQGGAQLRPAGAQMGCMRSPSTTHCSRTFSFSSEAVM